MPVQKVMSSNGHDEHVWDKADKVSLAEAEARFQELTGRGFVAVEPGKGGAPGRLVKAFDAEAETVLFQPQLQGG